MSFYGLIYGLFFGLMGGLIGGLFLGLYAGLVLGLIGGLTLGLMGCMINGGPAVLQHFTLRFILWRTGQLPWKLVPFLDYCTDRIFLRKVGGGYIFIHRYLLEYFASLTDEDIERLSTEIEAGRQPA